REAAGERQKRHEREEHVGHEQRRIRDVDANLAVDESVRHAEDAGRPHVRAILECRANAAVVIPAAKNRNANKNASPSAVGFQPSMIRLRRPSIMYETGLSVAAIRNQVVSMRFRGRFIDEMKRRKKSSGKLD